MGQSSLSQHLETRQDFPLLETGSRDSPGRLGPYLLESLRTELFGNQTLSRINNLRPPKFLTFVCNQFPPSKWYFYACLKNKPSPMTNALVLQTIAQLPATPLASIPPADKCEPAGQHLGPGRGQSSGCECSAPHSRTCCSHHSLPRVDKTAAQETPGRTSHFPRFGHHSKCHSDRFVQHLQSQEREKIHRDIDTHACTHTRARTKPLSRSFICTKHSGVCVIS